MQSTIPVNACPSHVISHLSSSFIAELSKGGDNAGKPGAQKTLSAETIKVRLLECDYVHHIVDTLGEHALGKPLVCNPSVAMAMSQIMMTLVSKMSAQMGGFTSENDAITALMETNDGVG